MPVTALDHYTINVLDLDATVRFYEDVMGFENGKRPPFKFPGAWLYCNGHPVVHLIGDAAPAGAGTGAVDHIAFRGHGIAAWTRRLEERGIGFRQRAIPGQGIRQVFVEDPNGITIEINFPDDARG